MPLAAAGPTCFVLVVGAACGGVTTGNAAGADVYLLTPEEWRSLHVVAGPNGAGAAVRGYGFATSGPLDVWAGATGAGPAAGAFFCVGLAPYLPPSCGDALQHVGHVTRLVP